MGSPALTIEGIYEDVIRGALLKRIDRGEPYPLWLRGAWRPLAVYTETYHGPHCLTSWEH